MLADVARRVRLDEQVEVARLLVAADGRVGPDDLLVAAVGLREDGADGDVLADGEAEDVGGAGEGEAVAVAGRKAVSTKEPARRRSTVGGREEAYMAVL